MINASTTHTHTHLYIQWNKLTFTTYTSQRELSPYDNSRSKCKWDETSTFIVELYSNLRASFCEFTLTSNLLIALSTYTLEKKYLFVIHTMDGDASNDIPYYIHVSSYVVWRVPPPRGDEFEQLAYLLLVVSFNPQRPLCTLTFYFKKCNMIFRYTL